MKIEFPPDVRAYVKGVFASCNDSLSADLALFPAIHEESLDMHFVAHFSKHQRPVILRSKWLVRIDAHFIGGGRHFGTWEVADIGLMMIFRKRGKVIRSKIVLLQSKKLYAEPLKYVQEDPDFRRFGLGRLLVSDAEHRDLVADKVLQFDHTSKYLAFKKANGQQEAMEQFEKRFGIRMYYLFYNPIAIPHRISQPLQEIPKLGKNEIGCRVIPKEKLDIALAKMNKGHIPSYAEIKFMLPTEFENEHSAGWRLEHFAGDLMMDCKEGLIDDSPNFKTMLDLMNQKARPMSSAISITYDMPD
jgi:hypothetical protein